MIVFSEWGEKNILTNVFGKCRMNYILHLPNGFLTKLFRRKLRNKGERYNEKECKISNEFSYGSAYIM